MAGKKKKMYVSASYRIVWDVKYCGNNMDFGIRELVFEPSSVFYGYDLSIVGYCPVSLFWDSYWNNAYMHIETHSS